MHGRLKVKTTAQQEEEKRKERTAKSKKYLAGLKRVFDVREDPVSNEESFAVAAQLLVVNPDNLSLWNFRREFLLAVKVNLTEDCWVEKLESELKITEGCLIKNPKSYGAWHHRDWILQMSPDPPWNNELDLCDSYLKLDERNFHCWDHRRIIVRGSGRDFKEELKFTKRLIDGNFSNYSAWHYRSKLLPHVYPPSVDCLHPVAEEIFSEELERVVAAIFTDPSDQSPWFYLRWLLSSKEVDTQLIMVGLISQEGKVELVVVFSKPLSNISHDLSLSIDGQSVKCQWNTLDKYVWYSTLDTNKGELSCTFEEVSYHLTISNTSTFKWNDHFCSPAALPESSKKRLEEIKEDCLQLNDLDPGNKWVLLSLVEIMNAINPLDHLKCIASFISQLKCIDSLRQCYYADLWSKIKIDATLRNFIANNSNEIDLSYSGITRLSSLELFISAKKIDLSGNLLKACKFDYFMSCEEIYLDSNKLQSLESLKELKQLKVLSLKDCGLKDIEQLSILKHLPLTELYLDDNPISEVDSKKVLEEWFPHLLKLSFSDITS